MQILNYLSEYNFVLWGIGNLGKKLFDSLNADIVVAIIDTNSELIGTTYKGVEIISFDTYIQQYNDHYIIITPAIDTPIIQLLQSKKQTKYFSLNGCPSRIIPCDGIGMPDNFPIPSHKDNNICIYGQNLFTIALIKYWKIMGINNLKIIFDKKNNLWTDGEMIKYFDLSMHLYDIENMSNLDIIYYCTFSEDKYKYLISLLKKEIINMYDFLSFSNSTTNTNILKYKDVHKNESCFIVATGPSLTSQDLDTLKKHGHTTISMNNIFPIFYHTTWRPNYYAVCDRTALKIWKDEIISSDIPTKFISTFCDNFSEFSLDKSVIGINCNYDREIKEFPKFSTDISKVIYLGWTVTYICIQLAIYMGFSKIYLLGVDFSASKIKDPSKRHFNENYDSKTGLYQTDDTLMLNCYQKAYDIAKYLGIKIYNATRGGYLEVFERVDFDSIFEKEI